MILQQINLYTADNTAETRTLVLAGLSAENIQHSDTLDKEPRLTLEVAEPAAQAACTRRRILWTRFRTPEGDPRTYMWRIMRTEAGSRSGGGASGNQGSASSRGSSEASTLRLTCRPLWTDLADKASYLTVLDTVQFFVSRTGVTAEDALNWALSPQYTAGLGYAAGPVAAAVNRRVSVMQSGGSVLSFIQAIAREAGGELVFNWLGDPAAGGGYSVRIDEQIGDPDPTGRIIDERGDETSPGAGDGYVNAFSLAVESDSSKYFSSIIPTSSAGATGIPVGIQEARWPIRSVEAVGDYTEPDGGARLTIGDVGSPGDAGSPGDLQSSAPIWAPIWEAGALVGTYVELIKADGTPSIGIYEVAGSSHEYQRIRCLGLNPVSAADFAFVRFVKADRRSLIRLTDPVAEGALGRAERLASYTISPLTNLVSVAGISADLSAIDSATGRPTGWLTGQNSTAAPGAAIDTYEATGAENVQHGSRSMRVVADAGTYVETIPIPWGYSGGPGSHVVSADVNVRVTRGRVYLRLVDSQGQVYPPAGAVQASGGGDTTLLQRLELFGIRPAPGPVRLRLVAEEDEASGDGSSGGDSGSGGAEFYVDSVTLVESPRSEPYTADMGPEALWQKAARELVEEGGIQPAKYSGGVIDLSVARLREGADAGAPGYRRFKGFSVGDQVTVRPAGEASFTTRIVGVDRTYELGLPSPDVRLTLSTDKSDFLRSFIPDDTVPRPPALGTTAIQRPTVVDTVDQVGTQGGSGARGRIRLQVDDPSGLVLRVEARTTSGRMPTESDAFTPRTEGPDGSYTLTVPLTEKHVSAIEWRVVLKTPHAPVTGQATFDLDQIPKTTEQALTYEPVAGPGEPRALAFMQLTGDEDTKSYVVSVRNLSRPPASGTWPKTITKNGRQAGFYLNQGDPMQPGDRFRVTRTAYSEAGGAGTPEREPFDQVMTCPPVASVVGTLIEEARTFGADVTFLGPVTFRGPVRFLGLPTEATGLEVGSLYTDGADLRIVAGNEPPTAHFTYAVDGRTVTLDASGSSDAEGAISAYQWSFGDGTTETTNGPLTQHTYADGGRYSVGLVVVDASGATDGYRLTIQVDAVDRTPPDAAVTAQPLGPRTIRFDFSGSTGPGLRYQLDPGDGRGAFPYTEATSRDYQYPPEVAFARQYTATLRVRSEAGITDTDTVDVTVYGEGDDRPQL